MFGRDTDAFEEIRPLYTALLKRADLSVATFAGGCFWCMEGPFETMDGVEEAVVGFAGGTKPDPTYEMVASGMTDYREGVQVFYQPEKVEYRTLVETFFWQVDPTDDSGQFADRGHHYMTAIYYHDEIQKQVAENVIEELEQSGRYTDPIVTEVEEYTTFYPAEDYHQQFYQKQADYYRKYKKGSGRLDYIEAMQRKFGIHKNRPSK